MKSRNRGNIAPYFKRDATQSDNRARLRCIPNSTTIPSAQ